MRLFRRIVGGSILGGSLLSAYILHENDWDLNALGFVRFGRSAFTAVAITYDYKTTVYGKNVPKNPIELKNLWTEVHTRSAHKLLNLCQKNGGVFIKVGQHLGALDFLIPSEYVDTLKILHSGAPLSSIEDVEDVIKDDLKLDKSELFSEFDEVAIGAASLAQVYRARLKSSGVQVAVKVQHKHVRKRSKTDMKTMEFLVNVASKIFPDFKLMWLVDQMKINIPLELNFVNEGENAEKLSSLLAHFEWLKVPTIYWKYSSQRVLTMEYFEGGQVNNLSYITANKLSPTEVVTKLGQLYSAMIFEIGFLHCDPHPGNLLVRKNSEKNGALEICLLDHGLYTTLNDGFRVNYANFWLSILNQDVQGIKYYSNELNVGEYYTLFASMVTARSWKTISGADGGITKKKITLDEQRIIRENIQNFISQISEVLNRIPPPMVLVFKTNDLLRGIEHALHTEKTMKSFITMTRYCIGAVFQSKIFHSSTMLQSLKYRLIRRWQLFRISLYEVYLSFTFLFAIKA